MASPQVEKFVKEIRGRLPSHNSVSAAADELRSFIAGFTALTSEMEAALSEAIEIVEASLKDVEILHRNSLIKTFDDWYKPQISDLHWPALMRYLENEKEWDIETIQSMDDMSTEVVSLLGNPSREQFRCRGLVVGYVQSGKTANMTAVIAKAVDAGYNLIVLLSGITNKLRAQTQRRISRDVTERHRDLWQLYTDNTENGDFTFPRDGQFSMPHPRGAQLVVMKKEVRRLNAFLTTIRRTPPKILRSLRALVIDDECDQASVNTTTNDYDMTSINEAIRNMIRLLPAVSYVGYTATPFANVFIDPFPRNKDELDDLYPEDFITSLPRPKDYFGTKEVFGFDPDNADDVDNASEGCDMLRIIPQEEARRIRPAGNKSQRTFRPAVTPQLQDAILWFLVSCAIRRHRGQTNSHMTMLVHTSQYVIQHELMAAQIRQWRTTNQESIASAQGEGWDNLQRVWRSEIERIPFEEAVEGKLGPEDLLPHLRDTLEALDVVVENGESLERLNYEHDARTYIVVGGSVLARGLTLEGLTVSFFLRTSRQYDTLLQMGRWFGFRHGYSDLPRLWTTRDLIANFRSLAHVEDEIRQDIAQYRVEKPRLTPLDVAVRVRAIPGLAITSAAKMRNALRTSISFAGKHIQTIRFDHRGNAVRENWIAATKLLNDIKPKQVDNGQLFKAVPLARVRRFLVEYSICDKHFDLKQEMVLGYIDKAASTLSEWNVAVISPGKGEKSKDPLGFLGHVVTNRRSRLRDTDEYADIKALMSKRDIQVDVVDAAKDDGNWEELKSRRPSVPLLLLYPINAESPPGPQRGRDKMQETTRVPLNASGDLMGLGIVFPGSMDRAGDYYSVEFDVLTPEQLEGFDGGEFVDE